MSEKKESQNPENYCVDCEHYRYQVLTEQKTRLCRAPDILEYLNPVTKEKEYPRGLSCQQIRSNCPHDCSMYEPKKGAK